MKYNKYTDTQIRTDNDIDKKQLVGQQVSKYMYSNRGLNALLQARKYHLEVQIKCNRQNREERHPSLELG